MATAYDLLLHLRGHAPHLARRLDAIRGLGVRRGVVTVQTAEGGWSEGELRRLGPELEEEAARIFGQPTRLEIEVCPPVSDGLPLPVANSKFWNHVAFVAVTPQAVNAVAVPKPIYQDRWVPRGTAGDRPDAERAPGEDKVRFLRYPGTRADAAAALLAALPGLLDDLAELARSCGSYAQPVLAFPGDPVAERLEGRLYGVKEWGTPRTPGPILHKYVGRLHYLPPDTPHLGLRLAAGN